MAVGRKNRLVVLKGDNGYDQIGKGNYPALPPESIGQLSSHHPSVLIVIQKPEGVQACLEKIELLRIAGALQHLGHHDSDYSHFATGYELCHLPSYTGFRRPEIVNPRR